MFPQQRAGWWFGFISSLAAGGLVSPRESYATTIPVGSGVNQAEVWLEFGDGALYTFEVAFGAVATDTTTGLGLLDIIESETPLTTVRQDFGFGVFIDGITFDGHSDIGYAGGDNWWHYWIMEAGDPAWTAPAFGAADRVVDDGDADGWVYGHAGPPVPEPASVTLLLLGMTLGGWHGQAQRRHAGMSQ